ncbi:1,4-dihydroxy-6-naphtoate synthase [Candidatus Sulfotelmatobacter kueseliae]|uniref:1,4-dihydroxy-6-naphtoate synthase n=1 Tax=Candidatus Sulfotelmatobacter kueseliae TaxID=2042962 RepID=A0A2U3KI57_9BACT|nr:1,4-dihydroxy-6-naphtoate synthase [Candidatus Sulfotelmatobacter kueseliae]
MTAVPETVKSASSNSSSQAREIAVAHSPDSDDAFMFYGLATNKVRTPGLRFTHTLCDIETLNQKAREAVYDVTAISFHAYPYVQDQYALMTCGGSVGEGYGPMIVSPRSFTQSEIKTKRIAVPGTLTTAYLALQLFAPGVETEVVPFDQIIPQVLEGKFEAGLIIHEGQLTYDKSGLHRVVDLGKWWRKVTGLPLPLGGNAIRRALGPQLMPTVTAALRESIQYGLDHREEALSYAMQFARDLDAQSADKFVGMYVNERTLDYGPDGREAVRRLLDMGHKAGIIGPEAKVEWVG